jgi:hypothetical protein
MASNSGSPVVGRWFKVLLGLNLVAMFFSGFGQMPIYARYYVTDLPGLGWSGDFLLNAVVHYAAAAVFIALFAYYLTARYLGGQGANSGRLVRSSLFVAAGLVFSGAILVFRDLGWTVLPPRLIVGVLVTHLVAALVVLALLVVHFSRGRSTAPRN